MYTSDIKEDNLHMPPVAHNDEELQNTNADWISRYQKNSIELAKYNIGVFFS